jgi:D-alanyl-D-alanine carboxypeptidase
VDGTEAAFVERMNETARRLGMTRTQFRNPHGLPDPEQVTTARDMAILTRALLTEFPERAEVFATPTVRIHKGTFHSQNDLLRNYPGGDGMKTGFTCASGYNVVASATRNDKRLVAIVLGAVNRTTRSERAASLLEAGFAAIEGRAEPAAPGSGDPPSPPFKPVALRELPLSPAEVVPPHDMARETRTRKCGNSERLVRRKPKVVAKTAAEADPAHPPVATSVVAVRKAKAQTRAPAGAGAKPEEVARSPQGGGG